MRASDCVELQGIKSLFKVDSGATSVAHPREGMVSGRIWAQATVLS